VDKLNDDDDDIDDDDNGDDDEEETMVNFSITGIMDNMGIVLFCGFRVNTVWNI